MPDDEVRDRLHEVLLDLPGGEVVPPTGLAARATRRRRRRAAGVAAGLALVATVGSVAVGAVTDGGGTSSLVSTGDVALGSGDATRLVGQWLVEVDGAQAGRVTLADRLELTLACGQVYGSWRAESSQSLFVALSSGSDSSCSAETRNEAAGWLDSASGFRGVGSAQELLDATGAVVAVLRPESPPDAGVPTNVAAPGDEAAPATTGRPATREDLVGHPWVAPGGLRDEAPYVRFDANGDWRGSDGCNGLRGRFALGQEGRLLAVSGAQTLMGCDNSPAGGWVSGAARAAITAEGDLALLDGDGSLLGSLQPPAPAPEGVPSDAATAPDRFTTRRAVPSCGGVTLSQGERPPAAALACLTGALRRGEGAELAVSAPNDEGAAVVTYYRATPGRSGVTVFQDSTRDASGSRSWTVTTCSGFDEERGREQGCRQPVTLR